jgi:hypothetical protein
MIENSRPGHAGRLFSPPSQVENRATEEGLMKTGPPAKIAPSSQEAIFTWSRPEGSRVNRGEWGDSSTLGVGQSRDERYIERSIPCCLI